MTDLQIINLAYAKAAVEYSQSSKMNANHQKITFLYLGRDKIEEWKRAANEGSHAMDELEKKRIWDLKFVDGKLEQ